VEGALERNEVITLVAVCLVIEGSFPLGAKEGLETCPLGGVLWLTPALAAGAGLDGVLLSVRRPDGSDFLAAKAGSKDSIRAKNSVAKAILTFFLYFSVVIILLLKYITQYQPPRLPTRVGAAGRLYLRVLLYL